eukprot:Gb_38328 [translate_table: standard]
MDQQEQACRDGLVLVVRKSAYGLPTACPVCLPAYIYLRFANISFNTHYHLTSPDSEDLPSLEYGDFAGFNSQTGGIFDILKKEGIADLDSEIPSHIVPDWLSFKALISSWLTDATLYELWVNQNDYVVSEIYFANLPWPIGKILYWKQRRTVMQQLGITCSNGQERASELYRNAAAAYESLSMKLEDQTFFFENRPTSLDAIFLGHALFILQTPILANVVLDHVLPSQGGILLMCVAELVALPTSVELPILVEQVFIDMLRDPKSVLSNDIKMYKLTSMSCSMVMDKLTKV